MSELGRDRLVEFYRWMLLTRRLEEVGHTLYKQGRIPGSFYTGRGNEAASVGVAAALEPGDIAIPLHRNLAVHLVRGTEPWRILANYLGRVDGPSRGRDGNIHLADFDRGQITIVSHLPAMAPVAVGCALAFRIRGEPRVAVTWHGDGSSARGDLHEAMSLAVVLKVVFNEPAVFRVIEDVSYGTRMKPAASFRASPLVVHNVRNRVK